MPSAYSLLPLLAGLSSAATLYASHYSGVIHQLELSGTSLTSKSNIRSGGNLPAWLTYDGAGKNLYCTDETFSGSAVLTSFSIGSDGKLTQTGKATTPAGGVANSLYGGSDGRGYVAVVHYGTSTLSTYMLPLGNSASTLQTFKYTMSGKGPNPNRQDAPHPHGVTPDPTGDFLIIPDLGADLIRIYKVDKSSGRLTECPAAKTPGGAGPRHGVFWAPPSSRVKRGTAAADNLMLFIANELGNSVSGWSVSYPSGGCLSLSLKQTLTPYANNATARSGTKVGEIKFKDNFLYSSNRNDKFQNNQDSMTTYAISATGGLTWVETTSSYGTYPRTFDINKAGDLVAIGDQTTSNVAIVKRDTATGKLGPQVANLRIGNAGTPENEDGLSAVVWAE